MGARRLLSIATLIAFALTFGPTVTFFSLPSLAAPAFITQSKAFLPLLTRQPTPTANSCNKSQNGLVNGGFEDNPVVFSPWVICPGCFAPALTTERASLGTHSLLFSASLAGVEQGGVVVPSWTEAAWLDLDFHIDTNLADTQSSNDALTIAVFAGNENVGSAAIVNVAPTAELNLRTDGWLTGKMRLGDVADLRGRTLSVRIRTNNMSDGTRWFVDQVELNFACGSAVTVASGEAGVLELGGTAGAR